MMKGENKKVEKNSANKARDKECQYCKKSNHPKEKCFWNPNNSENKLKEKQEVVVNEVAIQHPRQSNWKKEKTQGTLQLNFSSKETVAKLTNKK